MNKRGLFYLIVGAAFVGIYISLIQDASFHASRQYLQRDVTARAVLGGHVRPLFMVSGSESRRHASFLTLVTSGHGLFLVRTLLSMQGGTWRINGCMTLTGPSCLSGPAVAAGSLAAARAGTAATAERPGSRYRRSGRRSAVWIAMGTGIVAIGLGAIGFARRLATVPLLRGGSARGQPPMTVVLWGIGVTLIGIVFLLQFLGIIPQ